MPTLRNEPRLGGERHRVDDHVDDLVNGFSSFYAFLERQRKAMLEPDGPIFAFSAATVRYIWRNNRVYGALHDHLCDPAYLRDGVDRSIELERLAAFIAERRVDCAEKEVLLWPLVEAERDAMEDGDVPVFRTRADSLSIGLPSGQHVSGWFEVSGFKTAEGRLRSLDEHDLGVQLGFILGSLHARRARHDSSHRPRPRRVGTARGEDDWAGHAHELALGIAIEIEDRAIWSPDREAATWIAPRWRSGLDRYQLQPISFDLHGGAAGIALFLASVERVIGGGRFRRTALAALHPVRAALDEDDALINEIGLGAAAGLGSIVWTLTRVSELLEEPSLLVDARKAACLLEDAHIAVAPADVFSGLAGEILGLVALHAAAPEAGALTRASACGRRLVDGMQPAERGAAWITYKNRMLTGMSHGAAGIAYALLRLYEATGDNNFRHAASLAITYEDLLFSASDDNWPDLREETQPSFKANWCHGAPGIGLARLHGLAAFDSPMVRRHLDAATRTTIKIGIEGPDHLCCGNLGRAEFLLQAGEILDRPDLRAAGHDRVAAVIARARVQGGFHLDTYLPRSLHLPDFFMGTSGIGYEVLRSAYPDKLPSVLVWE